jgi:hypothetical protein
MGGGSEKRMSLRVTASTLKLGKALNLNLDLQSTTLAVELDTCALWLDAHWVS